jgi:hypothetical protein
MSKGKLSLVAGVVALGLATGAAHAMPTSNLGSIDVGPAPEAARWVCNPYGRCWWRPRRFYRPYAYVPGPRFYFGGPRFYGHRHGWRGYRRW